MSLSANLFYFQALAVILILPEKIFLDLDTLSMKTTDGKEDIAQSLKKVGFALTNNGELSFLFYTAYPPKQITF